MEFKRLKDGHILEIMLVVVVLGMAALFVKMGEHRIVALDLFFLPIAIAGYYLGRNTAGIIALFCALSVTIASTLQPSGFAGYNAPVMIGLALTVWAAVLGLTAILMGTLCDDRARTVDELHKAYVGVVEVLSRYLQSANPHSKARSIRIAELSHKVAAELRLPAKQIDDVRVAALLYDLENVEITTQLISNAVNTLEADTSHNSKHTFQGTELVHSLGSVLEGALPLLVSQDGAVQDCLASQEDFRQETLPLGARIICTVRAYHTHTSGARPISRSDAIAELSNEKDVPPNVLDALVRVTARELSAASEPALV